MALKVTKTLGLLGALLAIGAVDPKDRDHGRIGVAVEQRKRQKAVKEEARPEAMRNEAFLIATEGKLSSEIQKAIATLSRTEKTVPRKSTARQEMLERLVNLHLENAVYVANQEFRQYDRASEAWEKANKKGQIPKVNNNRSRQEWSRVEARAAYSLKEFPRSKNADELMFNMGIAEQFLGKDKDAARTYSQLISRYPNSDRAGEAYFQLGEYFFDRQDFRNAQQNYTRALRYKNSRSYAWSLYKLGWCSYNLGSYNESLNIWKQTVAASRTSKIKGSDQLREMTLADMIFSWAEVKQIEPAIAYYRANGGDKYIGKFLMLLAQTLTDQGKFAEAVRVLKRYQQVSPNGEDAPDAQKEIVALYSDLNSFGRMWEELEAFPRMYGPASSWAQANRSNQKLVAETQMMIKDQIMYYAKLLHKSAQKSNSEAGHAEALRGYNLFLKFYPNSREVVEVKWLMADIYFAEKKYREAGRLYLEIGLLGKDKASYTDALTKKEINVHQKSARFMLDSYGLDFESEYKVLTKLSPDFSKQPKPLTPRATAYLQACSQYQKMYPQDKKSQRECDIYVTAIYYRTGHREMSQKLLFNLAQKYPNDKFGPEAVEFLIPLYRDNTKALVQVADALLKIPAYQKGKLGDKLRNLKRGAEIDEIKNEKDLAKRARLYEEQAKKNPKAADADKLWYNAAIDYLKAGHLNSALGAYAVVVRSYPTSEGYKESLLQLAKLNDRRFEFGAAAAYYIAFAQKYPKDPASTPAVGRACELEVAGGSEKALQTCMILAKTDADGAKIFVNKMIRDAAYARNYERMASLTTNTYFKFNLSADERIIAYHRLYAAVDGKGAVASQAATQILSLYRQAGSKVSPESSRAVGEIMFREANAVMPRYLGIKLQGGTVDALAASIQKKAAGVQMVQQAFDKVLATKDPFWGVAALYQQGYAREVIGNDFENPPTIAGASPEDVKKKLASDAVAAMQEAKKFYQFAVQSIQQFHVYNEWAGKSVSGLARISGQKVSFDDWVVLPDFLGSEVLTTVSQPVAGGAE